MNVVAGCGIAPACCDGSLTALRSVTAGATGPPSFLWAVPAALLPLCTFPADDIWSRSVRNPGSLGMQIACALFRCRTGCMAILLRPVPVAVRAVVPVARVRRAAGAGLPCSFGVHPCHPCLLCLLCHLCLCLCHLCRELVLHLGTLTFCGQFSRSRGRFQTDNRSFCGQFSRSRSTCQSRRACHPPEPVIGFETCRLQLW